MALVVNRWLNNPHDGDAIYLPGVIALQLQSYGNYHGAAGTDAEAIEPAYLAAARDLYAGRIDFETFYARTPRTLAEFTTPAFRADVAAARGRYAETLDASQVYRWRRTTPLKVWVGGVDEVTPVEIGSLPATTGALLGAAPSEAIDAGPKADHRTVFIRAVLDQKPWFDSMVE